MDSGQIKLMIAEGEGLTIEFKEKFTAKIDEDIVAFANTRGGVILLGVKDNNTVVGENLTNGMKADINSIARNCKPSIEVKISLIGNVVAIEVPEGGAKPYSCKTGYFRRLDGTSQKMDNDELREIFVNAVPFEEQIVKAFNPSEDISEEKIQNFLREAGIDRKEISNTDLLKSLKLMGDSGIKNAGVLFFAKDVSKYIFHSELVCISFKGKDRIHILDRKNVRDDLLTQFNEAVLFLQKQLNLRSEIVGVNRIDKYDVPIGALREAVANAIMHRDYSMRGTSLMIEVYDDRVEIVNPGGLPNGLSKEDLGKKSVRRNELIADMFFRMDKVERAGTGIRRMKEIMAAEGLRAPVFESNNFFTSVFYRPERVIEKVEKHGTDMEEIRKKYGTNAEKILSLIQKNNHLTAVEIAKELGIYPRTVELNISKLKKARVLVRIGPKKGGYWEITKK